ncbi:helix-turn-helix domain-containing protein [Lentzea alba]|uniref:XRE family transcriptional regulator n=1 Tax=Lentzea alba TaxID=2714351 RepID=UPI0039BEDBEE
MNSAEGPSLLLARRLRSLRKKGLGGEAITQEQLAEAMGVSTPLISSWERLSEPVLPPQHRIEAYATFFASVRSVELRPYRLVELTDAEQVQRKTLLRELSDLRDSALGETPADSGASAADDLWRFAPDQDITIVCSELPAEHLQKLPYSSPEDPDYVKLYRYADLDALLELHGYLRAVNPASKVEVRGPSSIADNEYSSHLVLLGGVDFNRVTADVLAMLDLSVEQLGREDDADPGAFQVVDGGETKLFKPRLRKVNGKDVLVTDVAHFYRSPNPFFAERTVTICNGMYQRGTFAAVRALTDSRFRERNHAYVRHRFQGNDTFSIMSRVRMVPGNVVTPDWANPEHRLHEWPT